MFHSRTMNNKINRIHERALRLVYSDHVSSFDELLKKDRSFSIHHRNTQSLAIELYKFLHGLSPSIMKNVFHFNTSIPYNLRSRNELYSRNPKRVKYGTETISYLAPKIWSLVSNAIKNSKSLDVFKFKIRQWEPDCPCRLCKNYLQHVVSSSFQVINFKHSKHNLFNPSRTNASVMFLRFSFSCTLCRHQ